jgi:hypothetical protein
LRTFDGFVAQWLRCNQEVPANMQQYSVWHPGYAWACRHDAWDQLGGLIDFGIVGSADLHMACGLIGAMEQSLTPDILRACPVYAEWCLEWQLRAETTIKRNVGFVDGLLLHYFHGAKKNRGYENRSNILWQTCFDPAKDIRRDWQGLLQLTDRKPLLRDNLRAYFRSRDEDGSQI